MRPEGRRQALTSPSLWEKSGGTGVTSGRLADTATVRQPAVLDSRVVWPEDSLKVTPSFTSSSIEFLPIRTAFVYIDDHDSPSSSPVMGPMPTPAMLAHPHPCSDVVIPAVLVLMIYPGRPRFRISGSHQVLLRRAGRPRLTNPAGRFNFSKHARGECQRDHGQPGSGFLPWRAQGPRE